MNSLLNSLYNQLTNDESVHVYLTVDEVKAIYQNTPAENTSVENN